jgi:hypothetical protein
MVGAVEIDDPEIGDAAVGGDVLGLADVDDALAVGGDLRVGGDLDAEDVEGFEVRREVLGGEKERREEETCSKNDHRAESDRH